MNRSKTKKYYAGIFMIGFGVCLYVVNMAGYFYYSTLDSSSFALDIDKHDAMVTETFFGKMHVENMMRI